MERSRRVGLRPIASAAGRRHAARVSAHLPLTGTFLHQSSLANHQPGTAVKLRSEDSTFFVRVDKHESQYRLFTPH